MPRLRMAGVCNNATRYLAESCKSYISAGHISSPHTVAGMRRCRYPQCQVFASFKACCSTSAISCKDLAEEGIIYVGVKRCSHVSCEKSLTFNVVGSKLAVYCKHHATDGKVDVVKKTLSTRFLHDVSFLYCCRVSDSGVSEGS